MKILVVDDDVNICELIRLYLEKEGEEVVLAHNGLKALELFEEQAPDFVLLDVMMPGMDGITVCKKLREISQVPIILLTAKGETADKVAGLGSGADDYVCKPFDAKELIARIQAVARRSHVTSQANDMVRYDGLQVDLSNYELEVDGQPVEAPPKEIELLHYLASNPNRVFTRDQLLNEVWGFEFFGDSRTVDVHVKRIREKIDNESHPWQLKTVWGVGYKFEIKEG